MRYPMNMALRLPPSATPHRIGRFYTGRPSWRTRLRALRRRLRERALPLNDEEQLLCAAQELRREQRAADGEQEPVRAMRIVRSLPLVFLAADGCTTFSYGRALKNASSSVLYMLLQVSGEAAYYPWDERKHFWRRQRVPGMPLEDKANDALIAVNEAQIALHQYAPLLYYEQPVHPVPDIRFCAVRDPVERFVSAYQQLIFDPYREAHGNEEEHTITRDAKNQTQERQQLLEIDRFIAMKEAENPTHEDGDRHFRSQKWFLGCPNYYTHIFSVRQMEEIRDFLAELAQKPLVLPTINRTRRKQKFLAAHPSTRALNFTMPPLTAKQRARIQTLYAEDYEAFGKYF